MSAEPLVTAAIRTRNRADLVGRAVRSILNQTADVPIEIVVVDDCSTDDTRDVVRSMGLPHLRYVRHDTHRGQAATFNSCIENAHGQYIALLDDDDEWLPRKLEMQLAVFENESPSECRIVSYTRVLAFDGSYYRVRPRRAYRPGQPIGDYVFLQAGSVSPAVVMLPLALARRALVPTTVQRNVDVHFALLLEALGARFEFVNEPLTLGHTDDRPDRISLSKPDPVEWFNQVSGYLSPEARAHIVATRVPHRLMAGSRSWAAVRHVCASAMRREIGVGTSLKLLSAMVLPAPGLAALKRLNGAIEARRSPDTCWPANGVSPTADFVSSRLVPARRADRIAAPTEKRRV